MQIWKIGSIGPAVRNLIGSERFEPQNVETEAFQKVSRERQVLWILSRLKFSVVWGKHVALLGLENVLFGNQDGVNASSWKW